MEPAQPSVPGIHLTGIFLTSLDFKFKTVPTPEILKVQKGLSIRMHVETQISEDDHLLRTDVTVDVQSGESLEDSFVTIQVVMQANFLEIPGGPIGLRKFSEVNAPTLIFPFIREAIVSTTAKSPLGALLLPPMNISSMVRGQAQHAERITQQP